MKIAMVSTGGFGKIGNGMHLKTKNLYELSGYNLGNLAFWGAAPLYIDEDIECISWDFNPFLVKEKYDTILFPAANQISDNNDLGYFAERFEKADIPCIVLGLGAQAANIGDKIKLSNGTLRWLKIISERSVRIGVRGEYSKSILHEYGIHNTAVMGCPSFFLNPDKNLGHTIADKLHKPIFNVSFCQGEYNFCNRDVEIKMFSLMQSLKHKLDISYICQAPQQLLSLALNRANELSKDDLLWLTSYLSISSQELIDLSRSNFKVFTNLDEWTSYLSTRDITLGSRLHGNILSIQAGVMGVIMSHDSRMKELVDSGHLPTLDHNTFCELPALDSIRDEIKFSPNLFDQTRNHLANELAQILRLSGAKISEHLLKLCSSI